MAEEDTATPAATASPPLPPPPPPPSTRDLLWTTLHTTTMPADNVEWDLARARAEPHSVDAAGFFCMMSGKGQVGVCRQLVDECGVWPYVPSPDDPEKFQALHMAASEGRLEMVRYLELECGRKQRQQQQQQPQEGKEEQQLQQQDNNKKPSEKQEQRRRRQEQLAGGVGGREGKEPAAGQGEEGEGGVEEETKTASPGSRGAAITTTGGGRAVAVNSKGSSSSSSSSDGNDNDDYLTPSNGSSSSSSSDGDEHGLSPTTTATAPSRPGLVDLDAPLTDGPTALHLALKQKHQDVALFLIREGRASVNLRDDKGRSSLMWACCMGLVDCVRTLVN